jgi:peptidoglycan/LPS O-acetylase OafA/YrhL
MRSLAPDLPSAIPSLDGLRGMSILLVLLAHVAGTRGFPWLVGSPVDVGNLGVRIFFVISGFLITTLLLREHDRTGSISLWNFYIRRVLRIFPAFYAFLLCVLLGSLAGWIHVLPGDFFHALTYTMNYHPVHGWYTGHIWSLSVEEQFYIIWPVTVWKLGPRRAPWVSGLAMIAPPVLRAWTFHFFPAEMNPNQFHLVADAIATGCFLASVFNTLGASQRYLRWIQSPWFVIVPLAGLLAVFTDRSPRIFYTVGITVANVSIALCIDRFVRCPGSFGGSILNCRPLRFVGFLSYSLYLWQQVFLNRHSAAPVAAFPLNVLLAAGCAMASFYFVEHPIREAGYRKLAARKAELVAAAGRTGA